MLLTIEGLLSFSGLRVLITGGAGFIGSHFAERLLSLNSTVHVIDNLVPYYDLSLKYEALNRLHALNGTFSNVDITNFTALVADMRNFRPDVVVHLAAQAGVRHSLQFPLENVQTNVVGTMNVLEACRQLQIDHLAMASSSSVYGEDSPVPFKEEELTDHPISVYAATKRSTELLAHVYHKIHKMKICNLRFFTVYGPRGRPDMAVFKFIDAAFREDGNPEISVYGDGNQLREFTFIDDIVDGMIQSIDRLAISPLSDAFFTVNLGGGSVHSVNALIAVIEDAANRTLIVRHTEKQPGDVPLTQADQQHAAHLLNFYPKISLKEGIRRTVDWYISWKSDRNLLTEL